MKSEMETQLEYVKMEQAAEILGIEASTFERIAKKEFDHIRIKRGSKFLYSTKGLKEWLAYRDRCRQAGTSPLSWNELAAQNATLSEQVKVLKWALSPWFSSGLETKNSAAYIEQESPEDYDRAKKVLAELGFRIDWLRGRTALPPPPNSGIPANNATPTNESVPPSNSDR